MPTREHIRNIDDQWQALQPGWGRKDYEGERKMLYDQMEEGESIEVLLECGWEHRYTREVIGTHPRGVVAATSQRVLFLNKGRNLQECSVHSLPRHRHRRAAGTRKGEDQRAHKPLRP